MDKLPKSARPAPHAAHKSSSMKMSTRKNVRWFCFSVFVVVTGIYVTSFRQQSKQFKQLAQLEKDYGYDYDVEDPIEEKATS